MVVTRRAARGEGIAKPEVVLGGNAVGNVGKTRRTLVGRHHQIGVIAVVTQHVGGWNHLALAQVVGDIQQPADEDAIAGDSFGLNIVTRAGGRQPPRHEAALGPTRDDDRVLHLLRLDQAEYLGAVVLLAIRPAQPATGHLATAQVYALHPRRIYEDLVHRCRPRHFRNGPGIELEAEIRLGFAAGVRLIEVGTQRCLNQGQVAPQNSVLVEYRHVIQGAEDRLLQALLLVGQVFVTQLARQVEAHLEQSNQLTRDVGVVEQRAGDVTQVEAHANLFEVARVRAQQRDLAPGQPSGQHQPVERVVLGQTTIDVYEGILQGFVDLKQIDFQPIGVGEGEIMDPVVTAVSVAQAKREFAEHPQTEVLHDRQNVRQRQRRVHVVELAMQTVLARRDRLIEAHHQRAFIIQVEQMLHVDRGRLSREALAVAGRKALGKLAEQMRTLRFTEAFDDQPLIVILPGATGLQHFLLEARRVDLHRLVRIEAQDELHTRQHRFGEVGGEFAIAGLESLLQDLLNLQPRLGRITVTRHIDQAVAEAPVRVEAQEQTQAVALLNLHDSDGVFEQLVDRRLKQFVSRQHFKHLHQLLRQVRRAAEVGTLHDGFHLAADERDATYALGVYRRGEQPEKTAFAHDTALLVELAQRDEIRVGRPMHAAGHRCLGEREKKRLAQVADRLAGKRLLLVRQPGAHAAR